MRSRTFSESCGPEPTSNPHDKHSPNIYGGDRCDRWDREARHARSYRTNVEIHVITRLGGIPLAKVTPVRPQRLVRRTARLRAPRR